MAIKFAQKTNDAKASAIVEKAPIKAKSTEKADAAAIGDGVDLFESKSETPKRKKKR